MGNIVRPLVAGGAVSMTMEKIVAIAEIINAAVDSLAAIFDHAPAPVAP